MFSLFIIGSELLALAKVQDKYARFHGLAYEPARRQSMLAAIGDTRGKWRSGREVPNGIANAHDRFASSRRRSQTDPRATDNELNKRRCPECV
jgi:hypothetical protein